MSLNSAVVIFQLWILLACPFTGETAGMLGPACNLIDKIEIHYRNYWDIYLGNSLFLPKLREDGIYVQMLKRTADYCCDGMQLEFIFDSTVDKDVEATTVDTTIADAVAGNTRTFKFFFPEFADKKEKTVYDIEAEFVRLSRSPGHAIIMVKPEPNPPVFVGEIFVKSWAILIFLITFAWIIGILAWMADHYKNAQQFPNPFYVGMFEGFWWSVVTMTTVGYGDKAPKSALGRILAVVWIMISTVFLSLFTANATSILSISQAEEDHTLTLGKKIGVFNSKHFVEFELNLGAQIVEYTSTLGLIMALDSGDVSRIIFPSYLDFLIFTSYPEYESAREGFMLTNVLDHPFQIGMVLARDPNNKTTTHNALLQCLRSRLPTEEKQERGTFDFSTISWTGEKEKELKTALDSDNLLMMAYYFFGIIVFLVAVGVGWDAWRYYKKRHPKHQVAADVEMAETPVTTDEIHDIPSRESTPAMELWGNEASAKYKMSLIDDPPTVPEDGVSRGSYHAS